MPALSSRAGGGGDLGVAGLVGPASAPPEATAAEQREQAHDRESDDDDPNEGHGDLLCQLLGSYPQPGVLYPKPICLRAPFGRVRAG
jgi:hypothetical protein